jgi:hypothetical protein
LLQAVYVPHDNYAINERQSRLYQHAIKECPFILVSFQKISLVKFCQYFAFSDCVAFHEIADLTAAMILFQCSEQMLEIYEMPGANVFVQGGKEVCAVRFYFGMW